MLRRGALRLAESDDLGYARMLNDGRIPDGALADAETTVAVCPSVPFPSIPETSPLREQNDDH